MSKSDTSVPVISVIGITNIGKSSTIASLGDLRGKDKPKISNEPGVTRETEGFGVKHNIAASAEYVIFLDTPGFQHCEDIHEKVKDYCHKKGTLTILPDEIIQFCERAKEDAENGGWFGRNKKKIRNCEDDLTAWKAINDAHLNIVIIDARQSIKTCKVGVQALGLLHACGVPVIAVFNYLDESLPNVRANIDSWRSKLAEYGFHCAKEYDAIVRDYDREIELLKEISNHPIFTKEQKENLALAIQRREEKEYDRTLACRKILAELLLDVNSCRVNEDYVAKNAVEDTKKKLVDKVYHKVYLAAIYAENKMCVEWGFPNNIREYINENDYCNNIFGKSADAPAGVSISTPSKYWFCSGLYISVQPNTEIITQLIDRMGAIFTALRSRGQAKDDNRPLEVSDKHLEVTDGFKTDFAAAVAKVWYPETLCLIDNCGLEDDKKKKLSDDNQKYRDKVCAGIADALEKHCSEFQPIRLK